MQQQISQNKITSDVSNTALVILLVFSANIKYTQRNTQPFLRKLSNDSAFRSLDSPYKSVWIQTQLTFNFFFKHFCVAIATCVVSDLTAPFLLFHFHVESSHSPGARSSCELRGQTVVCPLRVFRYHRPDNTI